MNLTIGTSLRASETTSRFEKLAPSRRPGNAAPKQGITCSHQGETPCGHLYGRTAIFINQQCFVNETIVSKELW